MRSPIKTGSRSSPLALAQVKEIFSSLFPAPAYELVTFKTAGDIDKSTPLTSQSKDDFFTDSIDQALLKGDIDIAIHSAKDLPKKLPAGLCIFALTPALDASDAFVGSCHWADLKPNDTVGTSSALRQSQVENIKPGVKLINIRGTISERIELVSRKELTGVIVATCALRRLGLGHMIKDVLPWEGTPLQGQLAVVGRIKDEELRLLFSPLDARLNYGNVTLVGAGPSNPELITLAGINALKKADCVFYDYLVDARVLAHAPKAEHIYVGKRKKQHSITQPELCKMLKEKAISGKEIVRLKGGDPLIFGRGAEEIMFLENYHIHVEIIPGVSSATGIPSVLGIPLTARGISSSVAFLSGHGEDEHSSKSEEIHIPACDTIVFLMGLTKLPQILAAFAKANWPMSTPVLIVSNGTNFSEQVIKGDLSNIQVLLDHSSITPPGLIIVGNTVDFYKESSKKTFLHCGTNPHLYHDLGKIIPWPMIDIKPIELSLAEKQRLGEDFDNSDLVILTSPSAVNHFMPLILRLRESDQVSQKLYAAVGQHTAQILTNYGGYASVISREETGEGLYKTLKSLMNVEGKRVLFPRSSIPNPFLSDELIKLGATVYLWPIYTNNKTNPGPLPKDHIDGIIFTSPSTVVNFLEMYHAIPPIWEINAKGPVTQKCLQERGYRSKIML